MEKILSKDQVSGIQAIYAASEACAVSAHDVAKSLFAQGFAADSLVVATDKRPNTAFNLALWTEITQAVIHAPKFGAALRTAIESKIRGVESASPDESTMRRIGMGKINVVMAHLRKALKNCAENSGDPRRASTLLEILDAALVGGIKKIQDKGDKANGDVAVLLAAWRECRAKTKAAFK